MEPVVFGYLLLILFIFVWISLQKKDKRRRKDDLGVPRIIGYASNFGLNLLKKAETWSSDGTFSVCPEPFFQMYTVHAHLGRHSYPAAFLFLPGKKKLHYHEALRALKATWRPWTCPRPCPCAASSSTSRRPSSPR
jgi:hypothetical protein